MKYEVKNGRFSMDCFAYGIFFKCHCGSYDIETEKNDDSMNLKCLDCGYTEKWERVECSGEK